MLKKNVNRKSLTNIIYQNIGFSKIISENIVNDIFYIIISSFKENKKINESGFENLGKIQICCFIRMKYKKIRIKKIMKKGLKLLFVCILCAGFFTGLYFLIK